jgi:zinc transporter, ZIP family
VGLLSSYTPRPSPGGLAADFYQTAAQVYLALNLRMLGCMWLSPRIDRCISDKAVIIRDQCGPHLLLAGSRPKPRGRLHGEGARGSACLLGGEEKSRRHDGLMDESMSDVMFLFVAGLGTALACGLGAIPVFFLGNQLEKWKPLLRGLAAGLMIIASWAGLLEPAFESGGWVETGIGLVVGVLFVLGFRKLMNGRDVQVGDLRGAGVRQSVLVFAVLFIHSLPEGMAMGAAHASGVQGLNIFVLAAIALQNVPEGTTVAIPMATSGFSKWAMFGAAVLTSIPQPIGAPLAYLLVDWVNALLPSSLAFAGGAMLAVVALELVPSVLNRENWKSGSVGAAIGGLIMFALSTVLSA